MSTVKLGYRNERSGTISGIFPIQHERKIGSCASLTSPDIHCKKKKKKKKKAVSDMSFRQRAVIEFLVKEGNSSGVTYKQLRGVSRDGCMGASSVRRWLKHFKDGNTDIADQPRCGRLRTAATERNKQKVDELIRQDRRITVRGIAAQLGVGHQAILEMMEILFSKGSSFAYGYRGKQNG
jgi:transposase